MTLQEYDLHWEYTPGSKLIQADTLSCRPNYRENEEENDEEYYILIPLEKIISQINTLYDERTIKALMNDKTEEMKQQIINETRNDKFAKMTTDTLTMGMTPTKSTKHDWIINDGIIRYQGKVYIPENLSL